MVKIDHYDDDDDDDDDEGIDDESAVWSTNSDGKIQPGNNAARLELSKLDETEVISLLRTLYLKSGQPSSNSNSKNKNSKNKNRNKKNNKNSTSNNSKRGGRQRSRSVGNNNGDSRRQNRQSGGGGGDGRSRASGANYSTSSSQRRGLGLFSRGNAGGDGNRSRGRGSSKSRGSNNSYNKKRWGRGFFGGRSKRNGGRDAPTNIQISPSGITNTDFEYLNEPPLYPPVPPVPHARNPHHNNPNHLSRSPPLGMDEQFPVTPEEEYYRRQQGLPPRNPGLPPQQQQQQSPQIPNRIPENLPQPFQQTVLGRNLSDAVSTKTPMGPHNIVQGQLVGPPRVNSIRGTMLSPIVEANDCESIHITGGAASCSARTPHVSNVNANPNSLPYYQHTIITQPPSSPRQPAITPRSDVPTSLPLVPVTSLTSGETIEGRASLPKQIMVDPYSSQRQYIAANFVADGGGGGGDNTLVSDVSSSKDPWNRSPNSVVSQFLKDLQPNTQCCIRGTTWYDALHYCCSRMLCEEGLDYKPRRNKHHHRRGGGGFGRHDDGRYNNGSGPAQEDYYRLQQQYNHQRKTRNAADVHYQVSMMDFDVPSGQFPQQYRCV